MTNSDDRLDQALQRLRETVSEDEQLPVDLVTRVRQAIHDRQPETPVSRRAVPPRKQSLRRSDLVSLAMSLSVLIATGWGLAFRRQLLSESAGVQRWPDGTQTVFYSDGRAEHAAEAERRDG
jgi:hypothetical protein